MPINPEVIRKEIQSLKKPSDLVNLSSKYLQLLQQEASVEGANPLTDEAQLAIRDSYDVIWARMLAETVSTQDKSALMNMLLSLHFLSLFIPHIVDDFFEKADPLRVNSRKFVLQPLLMSILREKGIAQTQNSFSHLLVSMLLD